MDTAKMSHTSDDTNSSDDLIAELARLMADDARGEPDTAQPASEAAPAVPEAAPAAPEAVPAAPIVPEQPTYYSAPPSERLDASRGSESLYDAEERPDLRSTPKLTPTFKRPAARANLLRETVAVDRHETDPAAAFARETGLNKGFPNTRDSGTGFSSSHLLDEDLRFEEDALGEIKSPEPSPRFSSPNEPPRNEPVVAPQADDDDPIGDLIAAQLSEETSDYGNNADFGADRADRNETQDDNFAMPPVFGMGNASLDSDEQAERARDPLDDIESLIGEAVRAGLPTNNNAGQELPVGQNPLAESDDVGGAAMAAEAAILAATASMNTDANQPVLPDTPREGLQSIFARGPAAVSGEDLDQNTDGAQRAGWQRIVGPAIAGALLLAIGFGLYWVFGIGPVSDANAPVLSADNTPVKTEPDTSASDNTEVPRSVVFDQLNGSSGPGNTEQLVSRDQTEGASGGEVSRIITSNSADTDTVDAGLANRKVRTVTVRPDGTIVSGDDALAGGEVLPVERPDVPELPAEAQVAASEFANEPIITADATVLTSPQTALQPLAAATSDALAPLVSVPPVPRSRPINRATAPTTQLTLGTNLGTPAAATNSSAVDLIASLANQAVAEPVIVQAPVAAPITQPVVTQPLITSSSAAAYVQLSSQRSPEAAQQSLNEVRRRFGNLLTGEPLEVQRAELGERGIYFRVRMPASSVESANSVCASIKLNGGDCFVRRN